MRIELITTSLLLMISVTFAQSEVIVTYKYDRKKSTYTEVENSRPTSIGETNTLRIVDDQDGAKDMYKGDSRWVILSVTNLGNRLTARPTMRRQQEDKVTKNKFMAVYYHFENDSRNNIRAAPPRVIDLRSLPIQALSEYDLNYYVPEGWKLAGKDELSATLGEDYVAFYELRVENNILAIEIFPSVMSSYDISKENAKGKWVYVDKPDIRVDKTEINGKPKPGGPPQKNPVRFSTLPVIRIPKGKDSRDKQVTCSLQLRTDGKEPKAVKIRYFIIGSNKSRDYVVEQLESEGVVEAGGIKSFSESSEEISEFSTFYDNKSRLKGIALKGAIIQVWCDGNLTASYHYPVNPNWKSIEKGDVTKQMSVLARSPSYD